MPLREVQFPYDAVESLRSGKERFIVFFSSRLHGDHSSLISHTDPKHRQDCAAVEDLIRNTFGTDLAGAPSAVIVYVGQRSEWKTPDNIFRKEPWNVRVIPTIIRLDEGGKEIGRLVDGQNSISEELPSFIQ